MVLVLGAGPGTFCHVWSFARCLSHGGSSPCATQARASTLGTALAQPPPVLSMAQAAGATGLQVHNLG